MATAIKAKKKVIPDQKVFIVHGSETVDGKHVVHWGSNLNEYGKRFKDWDEALLWGFQKAHSLGLPASKIAISGPGKEIGPRARAKEKEKPKVSMLGRVASVIKTVRPYAKKGASISAKIVRKTDDWLKGFDGGPAPKKRKGKPKKGLYVAKSGGAHYMSRKPFKGAKAIRKKKQSKRR